MPTKPAKKPLNIVVKLKIQDFVQASGVAPSLFDFSDYRLARENNARHLRKGKINYGEGKGVAVHAMYLDSVGNTVALCADGFVRQFH